MLGAFLGLITVAILKNGLNHIGMTATYQQFIVGMLIVVSAVRWRKKRD